MSFLCRIAAFRRGVSFDACFQNGLLRSALGLVLIVVCFVATAVRMEAAEPILPNPPSKKNVIVIMTDEHNFRTLGCYRARMEKRQAYMWGPSVVETPNIDWIAKQGAMCTSFYATTPVCSPSRASFVSGLYPQATDVVTNNIPMNDRVVTFAELLQQHGYQTGYAGKWHLDGAGKPQWAPERKFGFSDNRFMFNRGHWKKFEIHEGSPRVAARKNGQPTYGVDNADQETFATDFLTDRAIDFVERYQAQPFCYMLSLPDPHGPDTVRAPYDTMYADQAFEKPTTYDIDPRTIPKWGLPDKKAKFGQSKYYGMVRCIDDNVGRLIKALKERNLLEKTIIVFSSDHGDLRGEHHRHNKGVAFEGSARVPFLIYDADQISPQTVVDPALSSVDFAPTLLGLLGIDSKHSFHGRDASGLIKADSKTVASWNDIAFVRGTNEKAGWLMAVSDRYKLVISSQDEPWLFDLKRDPDEVINQRDNPGYREVVRSMGKQLGDYCGKFDDPRRLFGRIQQDLDWAVSGKPYVSVGK